MRDSDIDALSADGAQDTERLEKPPTGSRYRDHYDEPSRTIGPRIYYTDRQGRRRWRAALPGELRGE